MLLGPTDQLRRRHLWPVVHPNRSLLASIFALPLVSQRADVVLATDFSHPNPSPTIAAHDLCTNMLIHKELHLLQPGVGHYGEFSGKRWERSTYPAVKEFIQSLQLAYPFKILY